MGGFAAATYMRGITLAHVPTTLLAQVDASVGGKVGVNLPGGKNLVGAFHQPAIVLTDPDLLRRCLAGNSARRLRNRQVRDRVQPGVVRRLQGGLGPISRRDAAALAGDCRLLPDQGRIVAGDEREAGPRRVLNFGHTAGHAFEALTRYRRFLHGEAVAYGMLAAGAFASARRALWPTPIAV